MSLHWITLFHVLAMVLSCGGKQVVKKAENSIVYVDEPRREGMDAILVALPPSQAAADALEGLRYEVEEDLDIVTLLMTPATTPDDFAKAIAVSTPSAIVLMNNPTLTVFRKYQETVESSPPALVILSSFLFDSVTSLKNTTGIAYEIPAVTVFPSLRDYVGRNIEKVGVLHRRAFSKFVSKQQEMAKVARLQLISHVIADDCDTKDIRKGIQALRKKGVDAFWVLNDNKLLSPGVISGWMEGFNSGERLPVVVGIRPLINSEHHFGSFAILPSHEGLGSQAGEMILSWAEEDWKTDSLAIQEPVAVEVVVDIGYVRENFDFNEDMVTSIDVVVH